MNYHLVATLDEVETNIKQFNDDMINNTDIINQLSSFRHWCYSDRLKLFGPSKYIGYKNMNVELYDRGRGKDGGKTEKVLFSWFKKLSTEDDLNSILMEKL